MTDTRIRIALVEDDLELCRELQRALSGSRHVVLSSVHHDAETALASLVEQRAPVDVAVVDLGLPGTSGIEVIRELAERRREVESVVFTVSEDDDSVFGALMAGASGYILKSAGSKRMIEAVLDVARGGAPMSPAIGRRVLARLRTSDEPHTMPRLGGLTQREGEILAMLAKGMTYASIARSLSIGVGTVQSHVKAIYRKLNIHSKAEALAEAYRRGLR